MKKGFTLIELLVVISIVSLLSSVVLAALNSARDKAKISKAKQEMRTFANAVGIAQAESLKILITMSSNGGSTVPNCSLCVPSCSGDLRNTSGVCYTNWIAVLNGVQSNTNGVVTGLTNMTRDPWGSPYLVDENQGETSCSFHDIIFSAGPNGTQGGGDDVSSPIPIPLAGKCP
jgi:prepilin-type N-terminal cleavage/methylation domain-containing protein